MFPVIFADYAILLEKICEHNLIWTFRKDILYETHMTNLTSTSASELVINMHHIKRQSSNIALTYFLQVAQDDGNILRPEYRKAVIELNRFLVEETRVVFDGEEYTYRNVCERGNFSIEGNKFILYFYIFVKYYSSNSVKYYFFPFVRDFKISMYSTCKLFNNCLVVH